MNDTDIQLFSSLSQSQSGTDLKSYLIRLQADLCDARNWKEGETKEAALMASRFIQERIVNKLSSASAKKDITNTSFE